MISRKRILVTGVLTHRSIAFAVADHAQRAGAEVVLTSFGRGRRLTERAAKRLPRPPDVLELDVNSEADLAALATELTGRWGGVDGVLHAIAHAPPDAIGGGFMETPPESALEAFRTSAYSYQALGRHLAPLMEEGGSMVGLDFDASVAWPSYDWMGVAKAALEAVNRYMARELGPRGIRANLVSAGPISSPAAGGIPGFDALAADWPAAAPLGWDVTDLGSIADAVFFLFSEAARAITGEILHVDGGAHAVATSATRASDLSSAEDGRPAAALAREPAP